jgi:hypothetical protein
VPGTADLDVPSCLRDDSGTLVARVSSVGSDRSGADYVLTRSGSF